MNAVPRRWKYVDEHALKVHGRTDENRKRDGLVIECEVVAPPSGKGRTVYVHFTDEEVTKALLDFRDSARLARMPVASHQGSSPAPHDPASAGGAGHLTR